MKRLSKNILSLFSADMFRRLLGFVSVTYLARVLGKDGFGEINFAFAVLAYGSVLNNAGLTLAGTQRIAQGARPEIANEIVGGRLVLSAAVVGITAIVSFLLIPDWTLALLIVLMVFALFPQSFFLDWLFQGMETMAIVSYARMLSSAVYVAVIFLFITRSSGVLWVAGAVIGGDAAAALALLLRFRRKFPDVRIRPRFAPNLLRQSIPLSVGFVLSTLVINYPAFILGIVKSNAEVGSFSAASKLVFFLLIGDRLLLSLLLPASARRYSVEPGLLSSLAQETLRWVLMLGLPIAAGGTLLAEPIVVLVFGPEYAGSAAVMRIFIWYFLLTMIHTVFVSSLIAAGKERAYGKVMVAIAAAYGIFVTAGAAVHGAPGAAGGVVASELFGAVITWRALDGMTAIVPLNVVVRILLAVAAMCGMLAIVPGGPLAASIGLGAAVYGIVLFCVRGIRGQDLKSLAARLS